MQVSQMHSFLHFKCKLKILKSFCLIFVQWRNLHGVYRSHIVSKGVGRFSVAISSRSNIRLTGLLVKVVDV